MLLRRANKLFKVRFMFGISSAHVGKTNVVYSQVVIHTWTILVSKVRELQESSTQLFVVVQILFSPNIQHSVEVLPVFAIQQNKRILQPTNRSRNQVSMKNQIDDLHRFLILSFGYPEALKDQIFQVVQKLSFFCYFQSRDLDVVGVQKTLVLWNRTESTHEASSTLKNFRNRNPFGQMRSFNGCGNQKAVHSVSQAWNHIEGPVQ